MIFILIWAIIGCGFIAQRYHYSRYGSMYMTGPDGLCENWGEITGAVIITLICGCFLGPFAIIVWVALYFLDKA